MTENYVDHTGILNDERQDSLGDGNFRARPAGDPDQDGGGKGYSRAQVSPLADAWAEPLHQFSGRHFNHNHAALTAAEHEAAVKDFLSAGGEVIKVDRGASSGLVLEPRKSNIRFGKGKEPFKK